ncbi:MAG: hypothetical protein H0T46_03275 [Deltaproteobacteria bacterium]|nr:hypothetical protein [Deltaproteobacteria bacterium]
MRRFASIALMIVVVGCSGTSTGPEEEQPEPDPKGWTITVDMSKTDRFVQPGTETSWPVAGVATATDGIASITVAGSSVEVGSDGSFSSTVAVMPGLTPVPVTVTDDLGHVRRADRTLLAARFLPDAEHNTTAASLVLDNTLLAAMSGGIASEAGDVNVAAEILARPYLSQDSRCATWPVQARQGTVQVTLTQNAGDLLLRIRIPNLYVYFEGECQGLLRVIPVAGEMGGTIDVVTRLTPKQTGATCLEAFNHSTPQVTISGWGFNVWGTGGPLQNWMVDMFSGEKATEAHDQLVTEVRTKANTLLTQKLADISVFDRTSQLELLGKQVDMHLCLGGLDKVGSTLVARIAARAAGTGMREAPGTPQIDGARPAVPAKELLLDANLVGQLLFASWKDGGMTRAAPDADISVLQILVPPLYDNFSTSMAQITVDAELPPLVTATPMGPSDLKVEIGDLMVDITLEGKRVFRFGVNLTLMLDLVPNAGKLVPTVVETKATVALLDELYDGPDAALEAAIGVQIGKTAASLLGDSTAIALPDLPGLGAPMSVTPDAGGRFLHVKLQ